MRRQPACARPGGDTVKARLKALLFALLALSCATAVAAKSPSEGYLEYHATLKSIFSDQAIWHYYTESARQDFERRFPPAMRGRAFHLMKSAAPASVEVKEEIIDGDTATLILVPTSPTQVEQGEAILRLENGSWKLEQVTWRVP